MDQPGYEGVGVSSRFGKEVRTTQLGFAAELTSTYDSTYGYDWKRLFLDTTTPGFTNPTIQPAGRYAFETRGRTDLVSGRRVWLEPSPDASGYVFDFQRLPDQTKTCTFGVMTDGTFDPDTCVYTKVTKTVTITLTVADGVITLSAGEA